MKYFPGTISRKRLDGTFDIDYDDGEKETGVSRELIKLVGGGRGSPSKAKGGRKDDTDTDEGGELEVGSKVEARYKGKMKYYPGKISRKRLDGTFDIDYDDGEKETSPSS